MREYNDRKVYDLFNNPFSIDCGSPALNIPQIPIDDSPLLNNTARYIFDPLTAAVSVASGYSVSKFTSPFDSQLLLEKHYGCPKTLHTIMSDNPFRVRITRG